MRVDARHERAMDLKGLIFLLSYALEMIVLFQSI